MKKVLLALAVVAAVGSIAPATAQAQFGGLGKFKKAVDKAKGAKDKLDSAKAMAGAAKAAKDAMSGVAAALPTVTEDNYTKFGKGLAAEKAAITLKLEGEALGKAITDASGLEYKDYNGLKTKIFGYYAATTKNDATLNISNADETKILDGHKAEIKTWVETGWPNAQPAAK